jgi:hypothetical protein
MAGISSDICHLSTGMHPGVGTSSQRHPAALTSQLLPGSFKYPLDRSAIRLPLGADKIGTVILNP